MMLLLEVLVGIGVFSVALLLLFGVFPATHRAETMANNLNVANGLALEYLERELAKPYDGIADSGPFPIPIVTTVNGVDTVRDFEITVSETELDLDRRRLVNVRVQWMQGEIQRRVEVEGYAVKF